LDFAEFLTMLAEEPWCRGLTPELLQALETVIEEYQRITEEGASRPPPKQVLVPVASTLGDVLETVQRGLEEARAAQQLADDAQDVAEMLPSGDDKDAASMEASELQSAAQVLQEAVSHSEVLFVTTPDSLYARGAWDVEAPWVELGSNLADAEHVTAWRDSLFAVKGRRLYRRQIDVAGGAISRWDAVASLPAAGGDAECDAMAVCRDVLHVAMSGPRGEGGLDWYERAAVISPEEDWVPMRGELPQSTATVALAALSHQGQFLTHQHGTPKLQVASCESTGGELAREWADSGVYQKFPTEGLLALEGVDLSLEQHALWALDSHGQVLFQKGGQHEAEDHVTAVASTPGADSHHTPPEATGIACWSPYSHPWEGPSPHAELEAKRAEEAFQRAEKEERDALAAAEAAREAHESAQAAVEHLQSLPPSEVASAMAQMNAKEKEMALASLHPKANINYEVIT